MRQGLKCILLFFSAIAITHNALAQESVNNKKENSSYDFKRGKKIIFRDDFKQDSSGKFPSKWRLYPTYSTLDVSDSIVNTGVYPIKVQRSDTDTYLAIASDNHYFPLKPKINRARYLDDTFTVEFDFRMDNDQSDPAIVFFDEHGSNIFECRITGSGEIICRLMRETPFSVDYPILPFKYRQWHHFALSFMHHTIKCYIDEYRVMVIPDCRTSPDNFIIAGNSYTEGNPIVAFKNIRLAANIDNNMFSKLITENKFTTHAIHYARGQSSIETESMDFIRQLADWLTANPDVKLEIDGFTDNDGDPKENLKLSKERANAVKAALETQGIDPSRLTANGFGAEKPIDSNDTPEGKAQNRRVEFIKQ